VLLDELDRPERTGSMKVMLRAWQTAELAALPRPWQRISLLRAWRMMAWIVRK